jgi:IS5 family transposase
MRKTYTTQQSIFEFYGEHEIGQQLNTISLFLDENPAIVALAETVLLNPNAKNTGRNGLSVESIVRAGLLKQIMGFSYHELSFLIMDSWSFSSFTRIFGKTTSGSGLQSCIARIDAQTWELMNRQLLEVAAKQNLEKGRVVRIDSTVTETDIHPPTDSSLLWDCTRSSIRLMAKMMPYLEIGSFRYYDHSRAVKRRAYKIEYARGANKTKLYKELLDYSKRILSYLIESLQAPAPNAGIAYPALVEQVSSLIGLTKKVISQTERRVLNGEKVPHQEKILSIFEAHTNIIVKGARDVQYGHKLNFTTGRSGLVLDVVIEQGNPADSAQFCPMIERQKDIYGRVPRQAAADGGYASRENIKQAKELGVKDVAFHKKCGILVEDMVKSNWVYNKLKRFRAGVEGNISCLKRRYGLGRCLWKGLEKFKSYIWSSSVAYNLMQLARILLAPKQSPG